MTLNFDTHHRYGIAWRAGTSKIFMGLREAEQISKELSNFLAKIVKIQKIVRGHLARVDYGFLQTNRKQVRRRNIISGFPGSDWMIYGFPMHILCGLVSHPKIEIENVKIHIV